MRKKYADCQRADGNCAACSRAHYGRDCHSRPITKLEWSRRMAGMTQQQLADAAAINIRQVQRLESGENPISGTSLRIAARIADALGIPDLRELL